uniref:Ig-like domain-containing protein n=1 Tax=Labrus bergylta TaxID=56723 RepID=A0A3Q3FE65_9LABR
MKNHVSYPSTTTVQKSFWFTKVQDRKHVDLQTDSQYTGRVTYSSKSKDCTLTITNVRNSDSAVYKFRFITNQQCCLKFPICSLSTHPDLHVGTSRYSSSSWAALTCVSSCTLPPHSSYIWFKNGEKIPRKTSSTYSDYFNNVDSYSCALQEHQDFPSPPVYAPKLPSVSVSPSAEIGSSVTLTCSSDANPAATFKWYKRNQTPQYLHEGAQLVFNYIQPSASGEYYCDLRTSWGGRAEMFLKILCVKKKLSPTNKHTTIVSLTDSMTLTCSSDANPAANYTWFKEDEDSPTASGQIFNINNTSPEHSGHYICIAQNTRGRHNSTVHLTVLEGKLHPHCFTGHMTL